MIFKKSGVVPPLPVTLSLSLASVLFDSQPLLNGIKSMGKKVLVHFDMDVLDSADIVTAIADSNAGGERCAQTFLY